MKTRHIMATAAAAGSMIVVGLMPMTSVEAADPTVDPHDWPMYNHDVLGSRYNAAETTLSPATVGDLVEKWRVPTNAVHATPIVVDGTVYVGDGQAVESPTTGEFHALDAETGAVKWHAGGFGPISGSAVVVGDVVVFADHRGFIYGLDKTTGQQAWPPLLSDETPYTAIFSSGVPVRDTVVFGVSSIQDDVAPREECCTARGSVIAVDPATGQRVWQTYTISDEEAAAGSSGATIWSTPTYDPESGRIFVTTGQNLSTPATGLSDAVIALDAETGGFIWHNQTTAGDVWNSDIPFTPFHNLDFADSAQVYRLNNGRKVVTAGQKSGFLHMFDAQTGELIKNRQLEPSSPFGGLFADTAQANGITFVNGTNHPDFPQGTEDGDLIAVRSDRPGNLHELWRFHTPGSPNLAGVAVANGVVYFHSSRDGTLYALNASDGGVLADIDAGVGLNGPSVSNGMVYLGVGDIVGMVGGDPFAGGAVVAYGLPEE